jgi:hypothetical protein
MAEQLKYADLLAQSPEQKESSDRQYVVEQKRLQLAADILATQQSLQNKRTERAKALSSTNLQFYLLSNIDDQIEGLEKGLARLQKYQSELF